MPAAASSRAARHLDPTPTLFSRSYWDKEATNTNSTHINTYFQAAARDLFNRESLAVLSSW